jgi:hypothetical protein
VIGVRRIRSWLPPTLAASTFAAIGVGIVALLTSREQTIDSLVVTTIPSGANVTIDGRYVGPSPVRLENTPVGSHSFQITKEGFLPLEERVTIEEDGEDALSFELRAEPPRGSGTSVPDDHVDEYMKLAEHAFDTGHLVSPYPDSALYYADAVRSVSRGSSYPDEMRARIRLALIERATGLARSEPAASLELFEQLERAFPNDGEVQAAISEYRDQISSSLATVEHLHTRGACSGKLSATQAGVRFASTHPAHSFAARLGSVRSTPRGTTLELRVRGRIERMRFASRAECTRFARAIDRIRRHPS